MKIVDSSGDEILETVLLVTGETVAEEHFGAIFKISVQVRAQAVIFDYKALQLRREYPISFTYLDVMDHYHPREFQLSASPTGGFTVNHGRHPRTQDAALRLSPSSD